ncbi:MAG: SIS domain-containing protein [Candidatus Tyrphobacter sp.]
MLGENFEREIREQPSVWRTIAASAKAQVLADALRGRPVLFLGSGSSLFMAQLGALALRKRGVDAHALAATEAPFDHEAYRECVVVACSQSGRSTDLLAALDVIAPRTLVALTNTADSPLAASAQTVIDVEAGVERAVPASKSVSATAAILLWAASIAGAESGRDTRSLRHVADAVEAWLREPAGKIADAGDAIASCESVVVLGTGYGLPIAREFALKLKEASYIHAEGFSAGEFRHGSAAILDSSYAVVGVVDDAARDIVEKPLIKAREAGSLCYTIGGSLDSVAPLGPSGEGEFAVLAWIAVAQMVALQTGRARRIDSDAPRGQSKVLGA